MSHHAQSSPTGSDHADAPWTAVCGSGGNGHVPGSRGSLRVDQPSATGLSDWTRLEELHDLEELHSDM